MSADKPFTTGVVFASDQGYMFLARGLVLSLNAAGFPTPDVKLVLIDLGLNDNAGAWMREHGVEIVPLDDAVIPSTIMAVITPVQRAMAMRPWLPQILPQFDHIIWLDCDLWLQNGDVIRFLRGGAQAAPEKILVAPGISHYNYSLYSDIGHLVTMQRIWYESCYDTALVQKGVNGLHYSGGVWGLQRSSPFWDLWKAEVEYLYPTVMQRNPDLVHLAEQIALNIVILRSGHLMRLDPLYNFHANSGGAIRLDDGRVVTNLMVPIRDVGVIHLANWRFMRGQYLQQKLLYRTGDYLTQDELATLMQQVMADADAAPKS